MGVKDHVKTRRMTIFFHANQLGLRGTEVALYDYAFYNEQILGNKSYIISVKGGQHDQSALKKFGEKFEVFFYNSPQEREDIVRSRGGDVFYAIKSGENDGVVVEGVRNCIHAVFRCHEPHGDVYAYVSEWLAKDQSGGALPWVPHMIDLPKTKENLRQELGIPEDAIVFGRYGGPDTFDIPFAQKAVLNIIREREDIYFLFMNTNPFYPMIENQSIWDAVANGLGLRKKVNPRQLIHLGPNESAIYKSKFINTCDAMLHARLRGETFGLAVGEFSSLNKPVITYGLSEERAHLEILGDRALVYTSSEELVNKIMIFRHLDTKDYDAYSKLYNPATVMRKFESVFLNRLPTTHQ